MNWFLNSFDVGLYSAAGRLTEGLGLFSIATATVLFPKVANEKNNDQLNNFTPLVCRSMMILTGTLSILIGLFAPFLMNVLYSSQYLGSVIPLRIFLIGSLVVGIWRLLINDLQARGNVSLTTRASALAFLVNIILSVALTYRFHMAGAAWALSASYILKFYIVAKSYSRLTNVPINSLIIPKLSDFVFYKNLFLKYKKNFLKG